MIYPVVILCVFGFAAGQIESDPADATIRVGEYINITCTTPSDNLAPNFLINNSPAPVMRFRTVTPPGTPNRQAVFEFGPATRADNQITLSCSNVNGDLILNVQFQPEISGLTNATVYEGESAIVNFTADANPAIASEDIYVTFGGQAVTVTASIMNGNDVTLTLSNLARDRSGEYSIRVNNSVGEDTSTSQVTVNFFTFTGAQFNNSNNNVSVGETITLDCSVQSRPAASVTLSVSVTRLSNVEFMNNMIRITNAVTANSGVYTCTADYGQRTATLQYIVNVQANQPGSTSSSTVNPTASARPPEATSTNIASPSPTFGIQSGAGTSVYSVYVVLILVALVLMMF